jgi:hypothetical protein
VYPPDTKETIILNKNILKAALGVYPDKVTSSTVLHAYAGVQRSHPTQNIPPYLLLSQPEPVVMTKGVAASADSAMCVCVHV